MQTIHWTLSDILTQKLFVKYLCYDVLPINTLL